MKKNLPIAALLLALVAGWGLLEMPEASNSTAVAHDRAAPAASEDLRGGAQTKGSGVVVRILPDDLSGSRHQRFILRLDSSRTLLIAHNIDLAPRIDSLRKGDIVAFYGEYEKNDQGGLIHWTHRDPGGQHIAGWLKHKGRTYQ